MVGIQSGTGKKSGARVRKPKPKQASFFNCTQCGGGMIYVPGTQEMKCQQCDTRREIPGSWDCIEEMDLRNYHLHFSAGDRVREQVTVRCEGCHAVITSEPNITSMHCPFCGVDFVATVQTTQFLKPGAVLPFHIDKKSAHLLFRYWMKKLWFLPKNLTKMCHSSTTFTGMYIPYWIYRADTVTDYRGERANVTTSSSGTSVNWTSVRGRVTREFDTVPVVASTSLPRPIAKRLELVKIPPSVLQQKIASPSAVIDHLVVIHHRNLYRRLASVFSSIRSFLSPSSTKISSRFSPHSMKERCWDLENHVPYDDCYLPGFRAESYQIDPTKGFPMAKEQMEDQIIEDIKKDIGGGGQSIKTKKTEFFNVTFKYVLLPVWLDAYRFRGKSYHLVVNGRSSDIHGERPYDWFKIALTVGGAILAPLVLVALLA